MIAAVERPARADWPDWDVVTVDTANTVPKEAAIRQHAADRDVYIAYTTHNFTNSPATTLTHLDAFQCDDAACSTSTFVDSELVGTTLRGAHLVQPSLALRKIGSDPIELTLVRVEKIEQDCDDDSATDTTDMDDQQAPDLAAHVYETDGDGDVLSSVSDWDVSVNAATSDCSDRGMSFTTYGLGEAWSCYTYKPGGSNDVVQCNSSTGATGGAWVDDVTFTTPFGTEEHPGLDFFGSERMVATSNKESTHTDDRIRIRFPDHSGSNPIINVPGTRADHPVIKAQTSPSDLVWLAWQKGQGMNAELRYSWCTSGGCDDGTDWNGQNALSSGLDEKYPHMATDDEFVMIAYTAIDDSLGVNRVYVQWKCLDDTSWNGPELVRTNTLDTEHQSMAYGRPQLVLNPTDHVAHLLLLDAMDQLDPTTITTGDLFWYRKEYTPCE